MQHILITGANRGIGLALTETWLKAGATVWAACRNPEAADALEALRFEHAARLMLETLDVTQDADVAALRTSLRDQGVALDVVVNNAGITDDKVALSAFDLEEARRILDVNVLGPMRVAQAFAPLLTAGEAPRLVNISSQLGSLEAMDSDWGRLAYNTSKAALNMVTRKLAHQLGPEGICVVSIHPGWVATDMGGAEAPLTASVAAKGIQRVVEGLTLADTNTFRTWEGEIHPW